MVLIPRGLLKHHELAQWKREVLSRLGFSSDYGKIQQTDEGLYWDPFAARSNPFDVAAQLDASGNPLSARITPGVIIGLDGFIVPTLGGVALTDPHVGALASPGNYILIKMQAQPQVVHSHVNGVEKVVVMGASWISAEIVTGDDLGYFDELGGYHGSFPPFDGVGWTIAGDRITTSYFAIAQWNEEARLYTNLLDGRVPVINGESVRDLENYGVGTSDTEAKWTGF